MCFYFVNANIAVGSYKGFFGYGNKEIHVPACMSVYIEVEVCFIECGYGLLDISPYCPS